MNPKFERTTFAEWREYTIKTKEYTFEDMQNDMDKIIADIDALNNMDIDNSIKLLALTELNNKKYKLLAQMHEKLNEMYY